MRKLLVSLLITASLTAVSQPKIDKVKVFVDCSQTYICNSDYIRTEINIVDFVRDRRDADVHILVITQRSNAGGTKASLNFIGLRSFAGVADTLTFFNDPTSIEDEQRKKLVQYLKLGLVRYVAQSNIGEELSITYTTKAGDKKDLDKEKDPWNYWVYQASVYGNMYASEAYKSTYFTTRFSANRETDKWKIGTQISYFKNVQTFVDPSGKTKAVTEGRNGNFEMLKVLNKHWAVGANAAYTNSLFSNLRSQYRFRPKVEYSILPYSRFNTERVIVQYTIGPYASNYYDSTIYFKIKEIQVQQSAYLLTSFTKPWGSINLGIYYSSYLSDLSKNNLSFNGSVSWKIVKGLNFSLEGDYSFVNDQITLRKGSATRDQLLIRNRELKSNYNYSLSVSVSYRFGSILNNFINPAFR